MPFSSFGLHADLLRGVQQLGFKQPTPIQKDAIPPAIAGRDVLACSMTGSGKTAAFGLPVLHRLLSKPRGKTRALILTPTRELAAQIDMHLRELLANAPLSTASIFGGVAMGPQKQAFLRGADILIATPGRLLDHLSYPYARLDNLEILVLDEADRMLDMGFLPDVRRILKYVPKQRQTLFFSATMPREIIALTREMLHDPATINLERKAAPAVGITETVYPVPHLLKSSLCLKLIQSGDMKSVLVFTRTKARADRLSRYLIKNNVQCGVIHGDRSQAQRTAALAGFKSGRTRVLVATDIAARGIDVDSLSHVLNFDVPGQAEDYIHRVGRTARASATGDAFTFVSSDEESDLRIIEKAINKKLPRVTLPDFDYTPPPAHEHHPHQRQQHHHNRGQRNDRNPRHERSDRGERNDRGSANRSHGGRSHSSHSGSSHGSQTHSAPSHGSSRPVERNYNERSAPVNDRRPNYDEQQPLHNERPVVAGPARPQSGHRHRPWEKADAGAGKPWWKRGGQSRKGHHIGAPRSSQQS
jgi:ATP-dependent RNA helicase RhlE